MTERGEERGWGHQGGGRERARGGGREGEKGRLRDMKLNEGMLLNYLTSMDVRLLLILTEMHCVCFTCITCLGPYIQYICGFVCVYACACVRVRVCAGAAALGRGRYQVRFCDGSME